MAKGRKSRIQYRRKGRRTRPSGPYSVIASRKTYIPRGLFPAGKFKMSMTYRDDWNLNAISADVPYSAYFSCNSIYDPDRSGVGHKVKDLDQVSVYYQHYTVLGSKVKVDFINDDVTPMLCFINKVDSTTPTDMNDVHELLEAKGSKHCLLDSSGRNKTITHTYSKKNTWGRSATDKLTAAINASPADEIFYQVSALNAISAGAPVNVPIIITLDYIVLFTERTHPPSS